MASATVLDEAELLLSKLENALQEVATSRLPAEARETVETRLDSIVANLRHWYSEAMGAHDFQNLDPDAKTILSKSSFILERAIGAFRYRYVDYPAPTMTVSFILNGRRVSTLMSDLDSITSDLKRLPSASSARKLTLATQPDSSLAPAELSRRIRRCQCQITAFCDGKVVSYRDASFGMRILRNIPSKTLLDSACRRLRSDPTAGQTFVGLLLYLRYASLQISSKNYSHTFWFLGDDFEESLGKTSMETSKYWILPERDAMPQLELYLYLSGAPIYPSPGKVYADILLAALSKLRRNWRDQQYLPDVDSKAILSMETTYYLALEDDELFRWANGERTRVNEVIKTWLAECSGMLVACITQRLGLSLLKYAVERGFTDSRPPPVHKPETSGARTDLQHGMTEESAVRDHDNQLWKLQPRFSARRIPSSRTLFHLNPTDILPLYYPAQGGGKLLSESRGEIHKVCIEPGYQNFTKVNTHSRAQYISLTAN
jgi:hypothetical protein